MTEKRVILLMGPTAVGKTGVSLHLAQHLGSEIISADSMQIYRHMDIGTAKPSPREQAMIRHHMIDIVEPSDSFSVGRYVSMVAPIIGQLHAKGKIPVVVGGTGLYLKAMTRGIFSGPAADWELREALLAKEEGDKGILHATLKEVDPDAAGRIEPNDTRRIVRALEVCFRSSSKITELQKNETVALPYDFLKIILTRDRRELYGAIEKRVDLMIASGLLEETVRLLRMNPDKTAMQAIGYKEMALYLRNEISFEEAVSLLKKRTRRYAKRQFTWFRKEEEAHWVDITGLNSDDMAFEMVLTTLAPLLNKGVIPCNIEENTLC